MNVLSFTVIGVCGIVFTAFVLLGGNEGFAALWLTLVPLISMTVVSFRLGFGLSFYFLLLLIVLFYTPLSAHFVDDYSSMFMLRFPFLYLIAFTLGTWLAARLIHCRYLLLMQKKELDIASSTDTLTGLFNTFGLSNYIKDIDYSDLSSMSIIFSDVNGLHELNNQEGHKAGDRLLASIGEEIRTVFKDYAAFRIGGDEFVVVCPNLEESGAQELTRKFNSLSEDQGYLMSTGYATWVRHTSEDMCDMDALLIAADRAMLEEKRMFHEAHPEFNRRYDDPKPDMPMTD